MDEHLSTLEKVYQARVVTGMWEITPDGKVITNVSRGRRELTRDVVNTTIDGTLVPVKLAYLVARHKHGPDFKEQLKPVMADGEPVRRQLKGPLRDEIIRLSMPEPDGEGLTREEVAERVEVSVSSVRSVCADAGLLNPVSRRLTPEEREKAFAMLESGMSQMAVADEVGIAQASLSRLYRRHKGLKTVRK